MQILPLKFIHDDDKKTVGPNLFNLAQLRQFGLPVVESVIVIPPVELIQKVISKYSRYSPDLKNYLGNLKREISELKAPEVLIDISSTYPVKTNKDFNLNINKLWQNLIEKWLYELVSRIERGEKNFHFTPQQVVFSSNFSAVGTAFFDESREHVVIKIDKGELEFKQSEEIESLVKKGNRKLLLPQVFYWVIEDGEIKIIKLTPFTQDISPKEINQLEKISTPKINTKTATKILLDYSNEVLTDFSADAVLLKVNNPHPDKISQQIEKILKFEQAPIIFYPNFTPSLDQNLEYAKSFLFFKNKKQLDLQIVLPQTFSVDEFLSLKRQFASLGIYSKGSLKIWKQFLTVADFINVEQYLDGEFDGAIIDLDKIVELIVGVDANHFLSHPRLDWINSLEKFFKENNFSKLAKNHKQVLITGKSVSSEELLNYFIKSGIWGIATEKNIINALRGHISFLEKNITKKSVSEIH